MPNDMMIAALNAQRAGKMDKPVTEKTEAKPETSSIESRISDMESTLEELCQFVGFEKKETPEMPGKTEEAGMPGKAY